MTVIIWNLPRIYCIKLFHLGLMTLKSFQTAMVLVINLNGCVIRCSVFIKLHRMGILSKKKEEKKQKTNKLKFEILHTFYLPPYNLLS